MHFDALTLASVVAELTATVIGGRVQQVLLPNEFSIGLELYAQRQRRYLLISAQPGAGRLHLAGQKLRRGVDQATPLLLLLRKYVRDSILDEVVQPDPTERLVRLRFDHPGLGMVDLIVEPMGRLSNALLVNANGNILDCIHRVRPSENAQRVLLPGRPYTPPPLQDRLSPIDDGQENYTARLQALLATPGKLWKVIADGIAGASPTLGREVAWRATGDVQAEAHTTPLPAVVQALHALWSPLTSGAWEPGVWHSGTQLAGYSPYVVHFVPGYTPVAGISAAVEQYYALPGLAFAPSDAAPDASTGSIGVPTDVDAYRGLRKEAAAQLARARRRVERQAAAAANDQPNEAEIVRLRTEAEWLLALHTQLAPGQTVLEVDLGEGEALRIALDATLSPVEQAQRNFKRAGKLARAAEFVPTRRAQLAADLSFLDQLATDLALAENQPQIAAVTAELQSSGLLPHKPTKTQAKRIAVTLLRYFTPSGLEIVVGRNARQNDQVTFGLANAADLWLHARDVPGAHVVVRSGGRTLDEATLLAAAQLAAYYSQKRGDRAVAVSVTPRRYVTRVAGGRPGQVHFRQAETRVVPADLPADLLQA
jgi:predicted ribosome quality control (RQC) complex YloA/Tae2 family protein